MNFNIIVGHVKSWKIIVMSGTCMLIAADVKTRTK